MGDLYESYENGMDDLLEVMGKNHLHYLEALTFQSSLLENIRRSRLFGDNENLRSRRIEILYNLNQMALQVTGKSFNWLCRPGHRSSPPPTGSSDLLIPAHDYLMYAYNYINLVQNIAENARTLFEKKLWKADCEEVRDSLYKIGKPVSYNNTADIPSIDASLISLQVELYSVSSHVDNLQQLLVNFCPHCRETSEDVKKQQQNINEIIRLLLDKKVKDAFDQLNVSFEIFEHTKLVVSD